MIIYETINLEIITVMPTGYLRRKFSTRYYAMGKNALSIGMNIIHVKGVARKLSADGATR
jgi:hypothetical protein